jgi:hypothetical protein
VEDGCGAGATTHLISNGWTDIDSDRVPGSNTTPTLRELLGLGAALDVYGGGAWPLSPSRVPQRDR